LPLTGPAARLGREILRGAELALNGSVELVVLDSDGGDDREEKAIGNAVRAAEDDRALAYLGDFYSDQVQVTAPILAHAGLLSVAPVATYIGLGGPTLVRLSPHDGVGARAIADWLERMGVDELLVVHDHDSFYGEPVGSMCEKAAHERGLRVRRRPVWNWDEPPGYDLEGAGAALYVGVAGSGAVDLWSRLHATDPDLWLLGSEGVAVPWLARELEPSAACRTRFFIAQRAAFSFYGYEAMALIQDALDHAFDRAGVVGAARATEDRDSVIGRYSIDDTGHTTSTAYGRLAVVGGELVWDRPVSRATSSSA
jgi:ABC-type branched-subunit amino acid transport system substrate-binding protein